MLLTALGVIQYARAQAGEVHSGGAHLQVLHNSSATFNIATAVPDHQTGQEQSITSPSNPCPTGITKPKGITACLPQDGYARMDPNWCAKVERGQTGMGHFMYRNGTLH